MKRKLTFFIFLSIMLSGCTNQLGGDTFFNHIDLLEQEIDQSEWSKIATQADKLKSIYKDNKWKLQLLGDEDEYEGLHESINNLIAAAKEKDSTSTRLELATVKSILEDIYSL